MTVSLISSLLLAAVANGPAELIAEVPIRAGDLVTPANSETIDGREADPGDPRLGREVVRSIYSGRPILLENTRSPRLVRRNDVVTVRYLAGALEITATGRALGDAGAGEVVSIVNADSRKTFQGVVQADGGVVVK